MYIKLGTIRANRLYNSPNDYMRFLYGYDSQYQHEGEDVLGFQKKKLLTK